MNKYQESLKRLEGMVLTSPFKNDVGDGVVDMNDLYKCGTQLQNEYLHDLNVLKELVNKAESFEWIPVTEKLPEPVNEDSESDLNIFDVYLVSIGGENNPRRALWDGRCFCDAMYRVLLDVKAWMPLPAPYKGEENERY